MLVILCALQMITIISCCLFIYYQIKKEMIREILFHMYGYTTAAIRESVIESLKSKGRCNSGFAEWERKYAEMSRAMTYIETNYDKLIKMHMIYPLFHEKVLGEYKKDVKEVMEWRKFEKKGMCVSKAIENIFKTEVPE